MGKNEKSRWKVDYEDTLYKVYDWEGKLAGYFFPNYGDIDADGDEESDNFIEQLNKSKAELQGGTLLVPMLKLELLDTDGAIAIDRVVSSLESCSERASKWNMWLEKNASKQSIYGTGVHTAREDRNMLSIALAIHGRMNLGDKNVQDFLLPLLENLHLDGLL